MNVEEANVLIGLGGIVLSGLMFFAGRVYERRNRAEDRQLDELSVEEQRLLARKERIVEEYVVPARKRHDAGPSLLSKIGLELLASDALIREAIKEMRVRSNTDPWSGHEKAVEDVDLVDFFRYVREQRVDFFRTSVEDVARAVRRK